MILKNLVGKTSNAFSGIAKRLISTASVSSMKFVQYKEGNSAIVKLGVLSDDAQKIKELSGIPNNDLIELIKLNLSPADISAKSSGEALVKNVHLLSPIQNPEKIICIGLNYSGHCLEQNKQPPKEPMFFSKFNNALVGPYDSVIAHKISTKIDWEVELAFIISKEAKHVAKANAFDYVFGYAVAQDISARDWQKERNGGQFLIGKSMDSFCPLGPAVVHHSLVKDPQNLRIQCAVNGQAKQDGNTSELIFKIDDIIASLTESITLKPGDIILTGTPSGVGMHRSPPEYLKPGDTIESEIEGLGKIVNKVIADN